MTQYEQIKARITDTKKDTLENAVIRAAKQFEGLDQKMIRASQNYATFVKDIEKNTDLTQGAKNRIIGEKHAETVGSVKAEYLEAIEKAKMIIDEGLADIEAAVKPQCNTGDERFANIPIWQYELATANRDELKAMYESNADDIDFCRLFQAHSKQNGDSREIVATARSELMMLTSFEKLNEVKRLISNLHMMYFFKTGDFIKEKASYQAASVQTEPTSWLNIDRGILPKGIDTGDT